MSSSLSMKIMNLTLRSINCLKSLLEKSELTDWTLGNARYRVQGTDFLLVTLNYSRKVGVNPISMQTSVRFPVNSPEDVVKVDKVLRSIKYKNLRKKRGKK